MEITKIEKIGNHYYKREDEFVINGVCGGKARVALELIKKRDRLRRKQLCDVWQ